ncbi:anti-anti-sigma factor [Gracilibacillus ureilyticus]|uniref:Anti-anti-sigma factor n=1 Tax=Gracilibacillus ureilyticus TaxID=531814 RepID=A0A1H9M4I7_9BACI|nr:STAS domain-containing protein [Gracilibacillus ureilyticus]SER18566.1 anti-anti-sigma factor [Gracilibacillus ureilyticus]
MDEELEIELEQNGSVCTIYLHGVLDYTTTDIFLKELEKIGKNTKLVILNFNRMVFIDSTGTGNIINLIHTAKAQKFHIKLEGLHEDFHKLFVTLGVYQIIESLLEAGD